MMHFRKIIALLALSLAPAFAQEVEPPPTPDAELASFTVAEGFEVTLFAAEPMVEKPIQMNFDPQGRLWVATSNVYPQVKPGEAPSDKIYVLEDTDADGKADKSTVFAEGLLIPTGVAPGDGGAYVANSTEVVHFIDSDGDLKADDYRVVLSGFGTEDTHHIIHTFRWGPDGRLYINQSVYIHSHVETPWGRRVMNSSGIWRYQPEAARFEIFSQGMWNPWGHSFDAWGSSFATDGAGDGGIHYIFPGSAYTQARDELNKDFERILTGLNPGSPKYCGLDLVNGRHLPDDWQNNAVTNDFRAHRVVRYQIEESENGYYSSKQMPDVLTSTSRFFRPIDVQQGPDGALYIADWCNEIINHGEVDFRDPRRDKGHGRIWRIAARDRAPVERPKLVGAPVNDLLEQLKAPENWTRQQAKMVLREMGAKEVVPALGAWVKKIKNADDNADHQRLEALWVYQGIDVPEPALLGRLLKSKDGRARAAAVRVIPDWQTRLANTMELLSAAVTDEHPRVRLEAVAALEQVRSPQSIELAMRVMEKPLDPYIEYALWHAATQLQPVWMPEFQAGRLSFGGRTDQLNFALQAVKSPDALVNLINQLKSGELPADQRGSVFDLIANVGSGEDLAIVFQQATAADANPATQMRALSAVERAVRGRNLDPGDADAETLARLFSSPDQAVRVAALRLAGAWKPAELREQIAEVARSGSASTAERAAAMEALAESGAEAAGVLREIAESDPDHAAKLQAVASLAKIDLKDAAGRAAQLLTTGPADADPSVLLESFLQREGGSDALAAALEGKSLSKDAAKLALRYINTSGRDPGALMAIVREAAGLDATAKEPTAEEIRAIMAKVQERGDAARGELVFRRSDTNCYGCHAIGGAGSQVGPDLRSIGASSPLDYIIESILIPNRAIKDGYQSTIVATKKGDVLSGIKVAQDNTQLVLRDAANDRIVIPLDTIRQQRDGGSLMPTGLADALTEQEFLDLTRFLSELGKPGPFGTDLRQVVRRWRVLDPAAADAVALNLAVLESPASNTLAWRPAYSLVSGELPPDAIAPASNSPLAFVRCEIEVTAAGHIGLGLNSTEGLALWIDGQKVEFSKNLSPELQPGVHTLTFAIDTTKRRDTGLTVELTQAPGGGHAQPVGGK